MCDFEVTASISHRLRIKSTRPECLHVYIFILVKSIDMLRNMLTSSSDSTPDSSSLMQLEPSCCTLTLLIWILVIATRGHLCSHIGVVSVEVVHKLMLLIFISLFNGVDFLTLNFIVRVDRIEDTIFSTTFTPTSPIWLRLLERWSSALSQWIVWPSILLLFMASLVLIWPTRAALLVRTSKLTSKLLRWLHWHWNRLLFLLPNWWLCLLNWQCQFSQLHRFVGRLTRIEKRSIEVRLWRCSKRGCLTITTLT